MTKQVQDREIIKVENLCKGFGELKVLRNINQHVNMGEVVSIIGPSGSGKSTFLRCLNLLEVPDSGKITFEGVEITDKKIDIDKHRQKMGMVFQHFNLFPHMTILENMMLAPMKVKGVSRADAEKKALELLDRVGLKDRADAYPIQLSGGQKQRVAIARAMVNHPKLLLADEPTGALDSKSGRQVLELFESLNESGVTVVMITHDRKVAEQAKRIVHIIDGEITEEGQEAGNEKEKEN